MKNLINKVVMAIFLLSAFAYLVSNIILLGGFIASWFVDGQTLDTLHSCMKYAAIMWAVGSIGSCFWASTEMRDAPDEKEG